MVLLNVYDLYRIFTHKSMNFASNLFLVNCFSLILQVPYCSYRVVHFHVNSCDGLLICEWAREWQLADQFECPLDDATFKIETVNNIEHWFEKRSAGKMWLNI